MSDENKAACHIRYCAQEGAEPRVWVLVERVERETRAAGEAVTIHSLWVRLADRAGQENGPGRERRGRAGRDGSGATGELVPPCLDGF
ncbi:MAG: hypothetical protein ACRYG8_37680 [Janthinobacterium lividum]